LHQVQQKKKLLVIIKCDSKSQPRATQSATPSQRVFVVWFESVLRQKVFQPEDKNSMWFGLFSEKTYPIKVRFGFYRFIWFLQKHIYIPVLY
jgi:hypothetical protein